MVFSRYSLMVCGKFQRHWVSRCAYGTTYRVGVLVMSGAFMVWAWTVAVRDTTASADRAVAARRRWQSSSLFVSEKRGKHFNRMINPFTPYWETYVTYLLKTAGATLWHPIPRPAPSFRQSPAEPFTSAQGPGDTASKVSPWKVQV